MGDSPTVAHNPDDYVIPKHGHGKLRPFKPGNRANPGGRPKHDIAAEIARAVFEGDEQAIRKAMKAQLKRGNSKAYAILAERGYGKLPQAVNVGGADGGPLVIEVRRIGSKS